MFPEFIGICNAARMVLMKMTHQYFRDFGRIDAGVHEVLMELKRTVAVAESQACIDEQDIFRSDHHKRLHFHQEASFRPFLQVILFLIKRYK